MKKFALLFACALCAALLYSQPILTYAGADAFYDIIQLSDGTYLACGYSDDLDWVPSNTEQTMLAAGGINNGQGTNRYAFILQLSADLQTALRLVYLPQNGAEDIRFLKTTNVPGETTGALYLSGNTNDTKANGGGYFVARLNNNFVDGIPDAFAWVHNVWAEGNIKTNHPWDVDSQGRVVYVRGQSHDYDWASTHRLNAFGEREVVPNWRIHWQVEGGEYYGLANEHPQGIGALSHSGIVFKTWGRCDLRSWTQANYEQISSDGNGGTKQGRWPMDAFFSGPCDPDDVNTDGPGYTGYRLGATPVQGASSLTIDRRTDAIYLGMNIKSVLPSGQPDFEPAVIAMDANGSLQWWSRLYHEVTPDGEMRNSSPDQYIDGLAVDYSLPPDEASLVVNARCHGNNVENLWEGNEIANNLNANGFQNRFTGSSGNIHISWLGKLRLLDGTLQHSTYVAEYAEGATGLGSPHPNDNLGGWPSPNAGWPTLNTTRLARNNMKVTADGSVCIIGTGRRTITTANAYQQMVLPANGGRSAWNSFVRVYSPDLSLPLYSSLVVGVWDTLTQQGGGNTQLYGTWKTTDGVVSVGWQRADNDDASQAAGNPLPLTAVPSWGKETPNAGATAVLAFYPADNLFHEEDNPVVMPNSIDIISATDKVRITPNPVQNRFWLEGLSAPPDQIYLNNAQGQAVPLTFTATANGLRGDLSALPAGIYWLSWVTTEGTGPQALKVIKTGQN